MSSLCDGWPGDFIAERPVNSVIHPADLPIATPHVKALRRPIESAQYTSLIFTQRCRSAGLDVSMRSRGDCFDNAAIESFHATLKKDLINRRSWPTKAEARTAMFDYIETFYNRRRRHSRLAMLSPIDFETSTLSDTGPSGFTPTPKIEFTTSTAAHAA